LDTFIIGGKYLHFFPFHSIIHWSHACHWPLGYLTRNPHNAAALGCSAAPGIAVAAEN
jgi:hypothetical protein